MSFIPLRRRFKLTWLPFRVNAVTIYPYALFNREEWSQVPDRHYRHEVAHLDQVEAYWRKAHFLGWLAWYFLYLLVLPIGWNPFRRRWETEAFKTEDYSDERIKDVLKRRYFLWL